MAGNAQVKTCGYGARPLRTAILTAFSGYSQWTSERRSGQVRVVRTGAFGGIRNSLNGSGVLVN